MKNAPPLRLRPRSQRQPSRPATRYSVRTFLSTLVAAAGALSAPAAPPSHDVAAAAVTVVQNDAFNTTASVTLSTPVRVNGFRIRPGSNRGDYNVQVGDDSADDIAGGVLMTCVTENGRDNGETGAFLGTNYVTSAIEANAGNSGYYVPLFNAPAGSEYNMNVAAAWFPYPTWLGGWARNSGGTNGGANDLLVASPSIVLGVHFVDNGSGRSTVNLTNLGYHSQTDGVLLVTGGKNEDNYALAAANANGTWTIFCKDNGANTTSYEQDYVAFLFVPKTNTAVISGKFKGDASISLFSGDAPAFAVTNTGTGTWRLTIPGQSSTNGVLLISAEGGGTVNNDNIVSYQPDGDGWIIMSRDIVNGTAATVLETPTNEAVASFVFIPGPTPGFVVTPTNGLITTESGGLATFNVELDTAPTADVIINVTSSDATEGTAAPATLTFTPQDWSIPQTVTVTGADDALLDGPVNYSVVLAPAASADANYNGLDPADVALTNNDNDQAGATIIPLSGLVTSENFGYASFTVVLNAPPTADVTIGLTSSNPNEGAIYVPSLTFTSGDWNLPQTVNIYGVDDADDDGDVSYSIVTAPAVSADLNYHGLDFQDLSVVNVDNDSAAVLFAPTNALSVVEGATSEYTVTLQTRPTTNVTITIASSNPAKGTVNPASLLFTRDDWNAPKSVTLTGVDNLLADGSASYFISNSISSDDTNYFALVLPALKATTLDNEALLTLPSGLAYYGLGMPAVGLDGRASLTEPDTLAYPGGTLTARVIAHGTAEVALQIRSTGTNENQINTDGSSVNFGANLIATFTGGQGTNALSFALNSNATPAAVQELLRAITFQTSGTTPAIALRTAEITFVDGLGATTSATKEIRVGLLRLTEYQEGADHGYGSYVGAADIALSETGSSTPWPIGRNAAEGLLVDAPDASNASEILLRFDYLVGDALGQLPTNAVIVSAELLMNVNNTGDGGTLHRMLIPWDANTDTWSSLNGGVQPDDLEARSAYDSQWGVVDGSGASGEGIVAIGVTLDVQAWVNGQTNFGWAFIGWTNNTDGTGISPSEAATVDLRPRLRVLWLPAGPSLASFRQGVNGYASAFDTRLREVEPDNNTNAWSVTSLFVDGAVSAGADPEQILIKFEDIIGLGAAQVPPGAQIHAAFLDLSSVVGNAMGDGGQFFSLLQPWSDTNSTWNTWTNGVQTDGVEAALAPSLAAGNPSLNPNVQGAFLSFDLTSDVQAWVSGARPNYGWVILPWAGGSDGWGFGSSESVVERNRPRLRVFFTSDRAVITSFAQSGGVSVLQFRGTAGKSYTIERAPTLAGPWTPLGSSEAGPDGSAAVTDASPLPGSGFYRIVLP